MHELIHAYDYCTKDFDPKTDGPAMACTEVRAASLSGDCRWRNEFLRGHWLAGKGHHRECVRRRAVLSMKMHGWTEEGQAEAMVDQALPACLEDYSPFVAFPY